MVPLGQGASSHDPAKRTPVDVALMVPWNPALHLHPEGTLTPLLLVGHAAATHLLV